MLKDVPVGAVGTLRGRKTVPKTLARLVRPAVLEKHSKGVATAIFLAC